MKAHVFPSGRPIKIRKDFLGLLRNLSFQKKLFLSVMGLILLISGMIGVLVRFIIFPYLTDKIKERGINISKRVAQDARTFILTLDTVQLSALLFDEKAQDRFVSYILVTDEKGRVLAHTLIGSSAPEVRKISLTRSGEPDLPSLERRDIFVITEPILEGIYKIGRVHVGIDKALVGRVMTRLNYFHAIFIILITVVGLVFSYYLSRLITRPIVSLTELADVISQGHLEVELKFGTGGHCWEMLGCNQEACPAYGSDSARCWFVDDTLCWGSEAHRFPEKLEQCHKCPVYRSSAGDEIVQLADAFNNMVFRLKATKKEVRLSREKYRNLFDNSPLSIFVLEMGSLRILNANQWAVDTYGYSRQELNSMGFLDLIFPEDAPRVTEVMRDVGPDHVFRTIDRLRHRKKDGDFFYVNVFASFRDYSDLRTIIATASDVTDLIEAETQLIQSAKMVTLGEMSAGIAHELNQPLNTIRVGSDYLKMMLDKGISPPREALAEVSDTFCEQVARASKIINHLREFGRKAAVEKEKVDINEPVWGVFTLLGQQLKLYGIKVELDLADNLPSIWADANRLEQVLINLVANARDAIVEKLAGDGGENSGIISIRSFLEEDNVAIVVSDTGTGIPGRIKERMFEPFFTTKEVGVGTGLGLSITYGIVRDYSGTIHVDTVEGEGTTIKLTFPPALEM